MSDESSGEFPFDEDTIFEVEEPDGSVRVHNTYDDLAADIKRVLEQDGREVFYGCDVKAWDLLEARGITQEMIDSDNIPRGSQWGYAARLEEGGEVVEVVQHMNFEKVMLLVSAFLDGGENRTGKTVAMKMEHNRTFDKASLLQELKEEPA